MARSRFRVFTPLLATAILFAPVHAARASDTADAVAISSGGASLLHAGLSLAVPNPVTPVTSIFYGCLSFGASIYSAVVDPQPVASAVITKVYAGPPAGLQPGTDALLVGGDPITEAPRGRVVTLLGNNFSFTVADMSVTVGGKAAQIFPLSTNTVMSILIPLELTGLPANVDIQVTVDGLAGALFPFKVLPAASALPTSEAEELTRRMRWKMETVAERVVDFDWEANLEVESPGLPAAERALALTGSDEMVLCASNLLPKLAELQHQYNGNPTLVATSALLLAQNPEIETQTDEAISDVTVSVPALSKSALTALVIAIVLALVAGNWFRRR
ncbi:MAG: IPT/TIG domain-containing protein [Myxococcota bacterium]|nr:IPT/TIG domain-containing protein [Myxococcota bacterium]